LKRKRNLKMIEAKSFGDYKAEGHLWVTLSTGEYYPDILLSRANFTNLFLLSLVTYYSALIPQLTS
jgi:hypothetical protein